MNCKFCENPAVFTCFICGNQVCGIHAKLRTICTSCSKKEKTRFTVKKAMSKTEKEAIEQLVKRFWGEEEQLTFNKQYVVSELPAYVSTVKGNLVGFVSYVATKKAILVVALGVFPAYQGSGIGSALIRKVEAEARKLDRKSILVSTSNDDMPALAFYQSIGFQIYEVKPNVIAEKHGKTLEGIGGLPIRDELRLRKTLR